MAFPSLSQWESLSYPCLQVAVQRVELNARVSLTTLVTTGSKRVSNLHKNAVSVPFPNTFFPNLSGISTEWWGRLPILPESYWSDSLKCLVNMDEKRRELQGCPAQVDPITS